MAEVCPRNEEQIGRYEYQICLSYESVQDNGPLAIASVRVHKLERMRATMIMTITEVHSQSDGMPTDVR